MTDTAKWLSAERLAEIKDCIDLGSHKDVPDLFDHIDALTTRALAAETEVKRLRNLAIDIARAAVPEWKKEFMRAAAAEEKLAALTQPKEPTK